MKFLKLVIVFVCISSMQGLSQTRFALQPSPAHFTIRNAGINVKGYISGLQGFLSIAGNNKLVVEIGGTLDPNTIETGIGFRDSHLKKADYFDVKHFPQIKMYSTSVKHTSADKYIGEFDLTIKGVKKNISVPFILSKTDSTYVVTGEFLINRLDFKLGEESTILSNDVKIRMKLVTVVFVDR